MTTVKIDAVGVRDAEDRVIRILKKTPDVCVEVYIAGKLAYRVSNEPPQKLHKRRGRNK